MKTNGISLLFFLALILTTSLTAATSGATESSGKLHGFEAGQYVLVNGDIDLCGEGRFYLRDNGSNLALDDIHAFDTQSKPETTVRGDTDGDKNCEYKSSNVVTVEGPLTKLRFTMTHICRGAVQGSLMEEAIVNPGLVSLQAKAQGDQGETYSCIWELKRKGQKAPTPKR